jgi:hypothetical protein
MLKPNDKDKIKPQIVTPLTQEKIFRLYFFSLYFADRIRIIRITDNRNRLFDKPNRTAALIRSSIDRLDDGSR